MSKRKTVSEFIAESKAKYGDNAFDYSKVKLTDGMHSMVTLVCREHGEFTIRASYHQSTKTGCSACGEELAKKKKLGLATDLPSITRADMVWAFGLISGHIKSGVVEKAECK